MNEHKDLKELVDILYELVLIQMNIKELEKVVKEYYGEEVKK